MNWTNVKLILSREVRDQLRDRRTLFMIAVLPMLLYPLLGMSFFQISQFMEEKPTSVLIVGARDLGDLPPLIENRRFAARLFNGGQRQPGKAAPEDLLELHFASDEPSENGQEASDPRALAWHAIQEGVYDAAVYFPPDFANQLEVFRQTIGQRRGLDEAQEGEQPSETALPPPVPSPEIIYTTARETSGITAVRLSVVLKRWTDEIGKANLAAGRIPVHAAKPFEVDQADVAEETGHFGAAVWSKILPVLLLVWAMTGAFYPAIDLCAGEKERGTLETLLSSPAERSEIVLGKLLTIMIFSMATAVLNLLSMGITGWLVLSKLPQFGPPPASAVIWLSLALVPVAAMFSALCLALAAFARSTKEGQYYLMPLLLVTMPLVVLPMAPGVELNIGNSLIPVTGVVLLLRSMLEGNFLQDWPFVLPVTAVTLGCCLLSIRWAVDQFNSESVLFREGERLDLALWFRHLLEDRKPTPTVATAVFGGVLILMVSFFISLSMPQPKGFNQFAVMAVVTQLVVIATPALMMTVMLTSSPRQTLLLYRPTGLSLLAAGTLALLLHPAVNMLRSVVVQLYPISKEMKQVLEKMFDDTPNFWYLILIIAVIPAICEELAFRGFILSGFRHLGHKWRAIFYSALFFGLTHALLQQKILACLVGLVIGYLVVQTGSILPGIVFHVIHNSLALVTGQMAEKITPLAIERSSVLGFFVRSTQDGDIVFRWPLVVFSLLLAVPLLIWFHRLPYRKSDEEQQQEAIAKASQDD